MKNISRVRNNNVKKFLTVLSSILLVGAVTTIPASAANTSSGGVAANIVNEQQKALETGMSVAGPCEGPYEYAIDLLETRGKEHGNGKLFMIDNIKFDVSDDGKKVEKSTISVEQSCDCICFFEGGSKYIRSNNDGSITMASTYYTKDSVSGFVSVTTGRDIPIGCKYEKTIYYCLNTDGTININRNNKGKMSIDWK